jgi:hypothetical protein
MRPSLTAPCKEPHKRGPQALHATACHYAQQLWLENLPARAILALCRALYLFPASCHRLPPYTAYTWMIDTARGPGFGFLGNPRISFAHQAMRMPQDREEPLRRLSIGRAWMLWYLTRQVRPDLPPDPTEEEQPPDLDELLQAISEDGQHGEDALVRSLLQPSDSKGNPLASSPDS